MEAHGEMDEGVQRLVWRCAEVCRGVWRGELVTLTKLRFSG